MKTLHTHIAGVLFLVSGICAAVPSKAQFIHFSMSVEPELSTDVVQNLDFGTFTANSGIQMVEKGNPNMGIFRIRALNNQHLLVTLNTPDHLRHNDRTVDSRIPITLEASYTNNGVRDSDMAIPLTNNRAWFQIGDQGTGSQSIRWETAYIYIYGQVDIGDVVQGDYTGQLVLNVEYY